jgi:hypothetical protein
MTNVLMKCGHTDKELMRTSELIKMLTNLMKENGDCKVFSAGDDVNLMKFAKKCYRRLQSDGTYIIIICGD